MSNKYFDIDDTWMNFQHVKDLLKNNSQLSITAGTEKKILKCREYLDKKIHDSDELFYGINTGVGFLQNVKISKAELEELQSNLLKSHACGMGEEVPNHIVKLMMMLKIKSLSYGY